MEITQKFILNILDPIKHTVNEASLAIMDVYESEHFNTEIKSDGSPVT